ncbi:MAG: Lrp/AsnC family transcriptional regulator [Chromatocurvus sp.]
MSVHRLDRVDRNILEALQHDAGLSNAELAEKICLSPSPCSRRVRILQEQGFFRGKVVLVNPVRVGLPVSVFVQVTLDQSVRRNLQHFEATVSDWPEVMECYLMAGDVDYLLRIAVPDLATYQRFLEDRLTGLKGVNSIRSSFSLKQVQYRTALPLGHLGGESFETEQR